MKNHPIIARLTALAIGTVLALLVAWVIYPRDKEARPIELVDRTDELQEIQESMQGGLASDITVNGCSRQLINKELAAKMFTITDISTVYDPLPYYRHAAFMNNRRGWKRHPDGEWFMVTNSHGMREDTEILRDRPDLRVLVVGDSHVDGVCNNDESFPNLLEAWLAEQRPGQVVEVLNHGTGGYSFYNYLGVIEKFADLKPDVFMVAVYGGNDFYEVLKPFHIFAGSQIPIPSDEMRANARAASKVAKPSLAQGMLALRYFKENPDQIEIAVQAALDVMEAIQSRCRGMGILLQCTYFPSLYDSQWRLMPDLLDGVRDKLELSDEDLRVTDRMATRFIEALRARGVPVVDAREAFAASEQLLYWRKDHHIDLGGQRLLAELLREPMLEIWTELGPLSERR